MFVSGVLLLAAAAASPFRVGEPIPDLTLPAISDGRPSSLDELAGRKVMLHVWASW